MEVADVSFSVNWVSVPIFLILATSVALFARHVSGGLRQPWIGISPAWWFVLLFLVPWVGLPFFVARLVIHRGSPQAITGRNAKV